MDLFSADFRPEIDEKKKARDIVTALSKRFSALELFLLLLLLLQLLLILLLLFLRLLLLPLLHRLCLLLLLLLLLRLLPPATELFSRKFSSLSASLERSASLFLNGDAPMVDTRSVISARVRNGFIVTL